jgi:hypothetical protein
VREDCLELVHIITIPMENQIDRLYKMYDQEKHGKKVTQEKLLR